MIPLHLRSDDLCVIIRKLLIATADGSYFKPALLLLLSDNDNC